MKTTFLILLLVSSGLVMSCDNDDDNSSPQEPSISGTWNLRNISGGIAGANADFEDGVILWNFDPDTSILKVTNNHSNEETVYDGFETGNYDYSITKTDGENHLLIGGSEYGTYTVSSDELVIDQNLGADGYVFSFQR